MAVDTPDYPFDQDDDQSGDERLRVVPQPNTMTLAQAIGQQMTRACDWCGGLGMEIRREPNNNGRHVYCPHCHSRHAWRGITFLRQRTDKPRRDALPSRLQLDVVWPDAGTRCVVCDRTRSELAVLHIGIHVHHSPRYMVAEHRGEGFPLCGECHELVNWRQRLVDRERASLKGEA